MGAVRGEIPAAGRGYDGEGGAGVTVVGRAGVMGRVRVRAAGA